MTTGLYIAKGILKNLKSSLAFELQNPQAGQGLY